MTDHVIFLFCLIGHLSLSFDVSIPPSLLPLQSRRLISRCSLSVWSTSQKRDYFSLVIFGRASKRRADKNRKLLLFIYLFQRMPTSRNNRSASAPPPREKTLVNNCRHHLSSTHTPLLDRVKGRRSEKQYQHLYAALNRLSKACIDKVTPARIETEPSSAGYISSFQKLKLFLCP